MHVRRLDELVVAADGQRLGIGQRLLESAGELVHVAWVRTLNRVVVLWGQTAARSRGCVPPGAGGGCQGVNRDASPR